MALRGGKVQSRGSVGEKTCNTFFGVRLGKKNNGLADVELVYDRSKGKSKQCKWWEHQGPCRKRGSLSLGLLTVDRQWPVENFGKKRRGRSGGRMGRHQETHHDVFISRENEGHCNGERED